jgi:hypothetical protein
MAGFLRVLGIAILVLGLGTAGLAGWLVAADEHFGEVAAAYARHPDHALFQTEYWMAAARHYGLIATALGGLLGGLALGGVLLALAELLRRAADGSPARVERT